MESSVIILSPLKVYYLVCGYLSFISYVISMLDSPAKKIIALFSHVIIEEGKYYPFPVYYKIMHHTTRAIFKDKQKFQNIFYLYLGSKSDYSFHEFSHTLDVLLHVFSCFSVAL